MEDKEKARHAQNVESSPIRYWTKNMLLDFIAETGNGKGVIAGFPEYPWWFGIDLLHRFGIVRVGFAQTCR